MFVGFQSPQVTWRDYNRLPPFVINPLYLPAIMSRGFGGFEGIFSSKKRAAKARRAAKAAWAAEQARIEEEIRQREEFLRKAWEQEMAVREESEKFEQVKTQYAEGKPPIYSWEELSVRNATGNVLIQQL